MFDGRHLSLKKLRFLSAPHTFSLQLLQPLPEAGATAEKANFYNHTFFSSNSAPPMFFFPSTFFSISTNTPPHPSPLFSSYSTVASFFSSPLSSSSYSLSMLSSSSSHLFLSTSSSSVTTCCCRTFRRSWRPPFSSRTSSSWVLTHTHTQISRLEFSGDRAVAAG